MMPMLTVTRDLIPEVQDMTAAQRPNVEGLMQWIQQIDEKHEAAHKRLRDDLDDLQSRHENLLGASQALRDRTISNENRLGALAATPPNVENVIMTPRVLVAIVVFTITVVGGVWSSTYGLRSDVRDIVTRMEAQRATLETADRLADLQSQQTNKAIDEMKRRLELFQYEQQSLKESVMSLTNKKGQQ
jgi:hypothetical protein